MEKASKDVLYSIAVKLELSDLLRWGISEKRILNNVCKNDNVWRHRLEKDYPDYQKFNSDSFSINSLTPKEAYIFLYQLTWIKKLLKLKTNENEYDIFLKKYLGLSLFFNIPLQELHLHNNQKFPPFNLPNLQVLVLYKNQLTEVPSFNLPNLQRLTLSHNNLTKVPSFNLPNLQELNLGKNKLTEIPSFNLPNLKYLLLDSNKLTEIPLLFLPNLENLDLCNNKLTKFPPFNLPNLKELYLDDDYLRISFNLHNLQYLELHDNKSTEVTSFNLPNLKYLDLRDNKLAKETIKDLERKYNKIHICGLKR